MAGKSDWVKQVYRPLKEYAELDENLQDVYRIVAALESLGVQVHRQLVLRLTSLPADAVEAALIGLTDIVEEKTIDARLGVYGWNGRHKVITNIITKYKFSEQGQIYTLLDQAISELSMTYPIEVRTVRNLCSASGGLKKAGNMQQQNQLLQKIVSHAPGERVPRHRLIANLIQMGDTAKADTEIKLFKGDFKEDGPVARYRVKLLIQRALHTKGLMEEDRITIAREAIDLALKNVRKYSGNKHILTSYCDVGIAFYKLVGDLSVYEDAIRKLKKAEGEIGDPDISKQVERYELRMSAVHESQNNDEDELLSLDDDYED